jgi:hypothetical protein
MKNFVHIFIGSHLQPEDGGIPPEPEGHPQGVPMGHPAGIPMGHPANIPIGVKDEEAEIDVPRSPDEKA